jgi:hypothetical protein
MWRRHPGCVGSVRSGRQILVQRERGARGKRQVLVQRERGARGKRQVLVQRFRRTGTEVLIRKRRQVVAFVARLAFCF